MTSTDLEKLAVAGGTPCVTDKPGSYLHGPQEIGDEEINAVTDALRSKNLFRFFKGAEDSYVAKFEAEFKKLTQAEYVLAVNSGTSGLICGMVGLGLSSGDEVIVPAYTYIATAAAALSLHAIPVICEVDDTLTMDPDDLERRITPRTKLICPVHMRGTPSQMDRIMAVAKKHNIPVLEDVAQANGGAFKGQPLGSIGDAGAFSMQHFKIITAGEGGAFVARDKKTFDRGACYHDSAYTFWKERDNDLTIEPFLGQNFRMSELEGAVAWAQIQKRDRILARTRSIKKKLMEVVGSFDNVTPQRMPCVEGDCSIALAFFGQDADHAKRIAEALGAEGMAAGTTFSKGIPDRHIFFHWDYVMAKRTSDLHGRPWNDPDRPVNFEYTKDMCPKSLEWLNRAVSCSITQRMSDEHVDSCCVALKKVLSQV